MCCKGRWKIPEPRNREIEFFNESMKVFFCIILIIDPNIKGDESENPA